MAASTGTVVVVDDEPAIQEYLAEVLQHQGYECKCFQESLLALAYLSHSRPTPDLLLTDVRMPGMTGIELLKRTRMVAPHLPVVLISGYYEPSLAVEAVQAGASEYLFKPVRPEDILAVVAKYVRAGKPGPPEVHNALADFLSSYQPQLDALPFSAGQSAAMENLFQALGFKRYETMQHSLRVAGYAVRLGRDCGLPPAQLGHVERGALLHDIGKIAIPHNVLLKPGPLTPKEWEVMRTHPLIGFRLLADMPRMREAAEIVYSHHERYDGKGYPRGLVADQIPIGARLFSIVDTFDAITSDRAYRAAQSFAVAFEELHRGSGTQFDPRMVDAFVEIPGADLIQIRDQYPDADLIAQSPASAPASPVAHSLR